MAACFDRIGAEWGRLDFVVHAIAFSDKTELTGRFINTSRENFRNSLDISCYSFIDAARRAQPLMTDGGSAMIAGETEQGLEDLSILHDLTLPNSPYQNRS